MSRAQKNDGRSNGPANDDSSRQVHNGRTSYKFEKPPNQGFNSEMTIPDMPSEYHQSETRSPVPSRGKKLAIASASLASAGLWWYTPATIASMTPVGALVASSALTYQTASDVEETLDEALPKVSSGIKGSIAGFGTSIPEIFASVTSIAEKKSVAAVNNILGSNLINKTSLLLSHTAYCIARGKWETPNSENAETKLNALFCALSYAPLAIGFLTGFGPLYLAASALTIGTYIFANKNAANSMSWINKKLPSFLKVKFKSANDESNAEEQKKLPFFNWNYVKLFGFAFAGLLAASGLLASAGLATGVLFGASDFWLGIIFAVATSAGEIFLGATSYVKAYQAEKAGDHELAKEKKDFAAGNVLGSTIFNNTAVGGVMAASAMVLDPGVLSGLLAIPGVQFLFLASMFVTFALCAMYLFAPTPQTPGANNNRGEPAASLAPSPA